MEPKTVLEQEEQLAEELLETRLLTPQQAAFSSTVGGFVSLRLGERVYPRVHIYRAFPFTDPNRYLSVRESEGENREIGMIEDLTDWDEATVLLINRQLSLRYFAPKIQKIREIKEEYGYSYWWVDTDKGVCRFTCDQNAVTKLSDTRLIVTDVDGNRFELPDATVLSAKELRMVDLYM